MKFLAVLAACTLLAACGGAREPVEEQAVPFPGN
jgi:hypothetical protein